MNTKTVGDYSQLMVTAEFVKHDIPVCLPYGDNYRYDLVIELNGFKKVQVKTGRYVDGAIVFKTCSMEYHKGKSAKSYIGEVDYIAVYCDKTKECYLIPIESAPSKEMKLRVEPPKNNQTSGVRWAKDFVLSKIIV